MTLLSRMAATPLSLAVLISLTKPCFRHIMAICSGIYIKVEPTGCYRLAYHNR